MATKKKTTKKKAVKHKATGLRVKVSKKLLAKRTVKKKVAKRKSTKRKTSGLRAKVSKKLSAKKTSDKEEILYMGISNPVEIRKTILENARDMVQFLQLFEKFRIIREEKSEATRLLKKEIKQLHTLINKLKRALPKTSLRTRKKVEEEVKEAEEEFFEEEPTTKTPKKAPKTELPDLGIDDIDALESELREIEDKLSFL